MYLLAHDFFMNYAAIIETQILFLIEASNVMRIRKQMNKMWQRVFVCMHSVMYECCELISLQKSIYYAWIWNLFHSIELYLYVRTDIQIQYWYLLIQ